MAVLPSNAPRDIMHAYIVDIRRPVKLTGVSSVESQWQRIEQDLRLTNGRETRSKQRSVEGEKLHDGRVAVVCKRLWAWFTLHKT